MYLTKNSGDLNIVNIEYKLYASCLKHIYKILLSIEIQKNGSKF
jgi:hypothetical protein